jgi:ATP-binding cassette, subfamily C, bacterial exporter for protease/lipase
MSYLRMARGGDRPDAADGALQALVRPHWPLARRLLLFSFLINLLTLTVSIFTMQVYDRVLTSQSRDTLLFLTIATLVAIGLSAILEGVRQQVANGFAAWFARTLGPNLLLRSLEHRLVLPNVRLEALRELMAVKNFVATPVLFNLVDMLWVPLYLAFIFLLHPLFGALATVGAGLLLGLALLNEWTTRARIRDGQAQTSANLAFAESLVRNSEAIDAMGMAQDTVACWAERHAYELEHARATNSISVRILAVAKFVRYLIQVALLAVGALLVLDLELTGGAMIAGTIIVARLLAPIDASIGYWRQFVMARQALKRIDQFCNLPPIRTSEVQLPVPEGDVSVEGVTYFAPGLANPILRGVSVKIAAGEMLAIIGPSASGKTTLSRLLVGILRPSQGHVRLDGADVFDWCRTDFGPNVGYLPQDVELLPGSIRQNISRFSPLATDEEVIAAAQLADCHQMILSFDKGYDLVLGDGGLQISGGQRQRVGLARALYGRPRLVVLDEPNASLDTKGDAALVSAIRELKARRITTIIVSHRSNLLQMADKILVLQEGRVTNFGDAERVLGDLANGAAARTPGRRRVTQGEALPEPIQAPAN